MTGPLGLLATAVLFSLLQSGFCYQKFVWKCETGYMECHPGSSLCCSCLDEDYVERCKEKLETATESSVIAGVVLGVGAAMILVVAVLVVCWRRRKRRQLAARITAQVLAAQVVHQMNNPAPNFPQYAQQGNGYNHLVNIG